jgi:hypothetical protein
VASVMEFKAHNILGIRERDIWLSIVKDRVIIILLLIERTAIGITHFEASS